MKANELRIGNLVLHEINGIEPITLGLLKAIAALELIPNLKENPFKPIELTEEWLIKFGFKLAYSAIHEFITIYNLEDNQFERSNDNTYFNGNKVNHINYVHQLQNLYFALTGEELKIKDK